MDIALRRVTVLPGRPGSNDEERVVVNLDVDVGAWIDLSLHEGRLIEKESPSLICLRQPPNDRIPRGRRL